MKNENDKKRMESRSIRLRPDTLDDLKTLADKNGKGITVYMREILENFITTQKFLDQLTSGVTVE
jgi:predicted DNA-binding protein